MVKSGDIELKVGVFVAIGLTLTMLAIFVLGSSENLLTKKVNYFVYFSNVEGLISGAKVVLSGIHVGTVDSLDFDMSRREIRVQLSLAKKTALWIRKDSEAEIATQGVLGDKFINIIPGSAEKEALAAGSTIPIRPSKSLSQFLTQGDQLIVTLNNIAINIDRLLKSLDSGHRAEAIAINLQTTSKHIAEATGKINRELDDFRISGMIKTLQNIFQKIDNGTGSLGAFINDPSLYEHTKALIGEANRNRIVRNLVRRTIQQSNESKEDTKSKEIPKK